MEPKNFQKIRVSLLFFLFFFFGLGLSQNEVTHILKLKNGSSIKCSIVEIKANEYIKIETNDGSIFVFTVSEIESIKEINNEKANISEAVLDAENPYTIHKKIAWKGLLYSWGATAIGAAAMGDLYVGTTIIPIVGPFITIARVESDPNADYLPGGDGLLIVSGVVQSSFAIYYLISYIGGSNYTPDSGLSIYPTTKNLGIQLVYNF